MADDDLYFTEPGPHRQPALITKSGQKLYKLIPLKAESSHTPDNSVTFAKSQTKIERLKKQIKFHKSVQSSGGTRLAMLMRGLEDQLAEKETAGDTSLAEKAECAAATAAEIDSGYVSEEVAVTANRPTAKFCVSVDRSLKPARAPVPFALHVNITVNSVPIHQSSHYSLDATKFLTLPDLLSHIESIYLPQLSANKSYQTLNFSPMPGIAPDPNPETYQTSPGAGILFLGETYNRAPDSYSRTRIALDEYANYNEEKYKNWYCRNVTHGQVPKRKGWTSRYAWEGDELDVSFSMHLKEKKVGK